MSRFAEITMGPFISSLIFLAGSQSQQNHVHNEENVPEQPLRPVQAERNWFVLQLDPGNNLRSDLGDLEIGEA